MKRRTSLRLSLAVTVLVAGSLLGAVPSAKATSSWSASSLLYAQLNLERGETWRMDCVLPNGVGRDFAMFEYDRGEYWYEDEGGSSRGSSEGYGWGGGPSTWNIQGDLAGNRFEFPLFEPGPDGYPDRIEFSTEGTSEGFEILVMATAVWDATMECTLATDRQGALPVVELEPNRAVRASVAAFDSVASVDSPVVSAGIGSQLTSVHEGTVATVFDFGGFWASSRLVTVERPNGKVDSALGLVVLSEIDGDGEWKFTLEGVNAFARAPLWTMDLPPSPFASNPPWQS